MMVTKYKRPTPKQPVCLTSPFAAFVYRKDSAEFFRNSGGISLMTFAGLALMGPYVVDVPNTKEMNMASHATNADNLTMPVS